MVISHFLLSVLILHPLVLGLLLALCSVLTLSSPTSPLYLGTSCLRTPRWNVSQTNLSLAIVCSRVTDTTHVFTACVYCRRSVSCICFHAKFPGACIYCLCLHNVACWGAPIASFLVAMANKKKFIIVEQHMTCDSVRPPFINRQPIHRGHGPGTIIAICRRAKPHAAI
jgi:hypothetical protein